MSRSRQEHDQKYWDSLKVQADEQEKQKQNVENLIKTAGNNEALRRSLLIIYYNERWRKIREKKIAKGEDDKSGTIRFLLEQDIKNRDSEYCKLGKIAYDLFTKTMYKDVLDGGGRKKSRKKRTKRKKRSRKRRKSRRR